MAARLVLLSFFLANTALAAGTPPIAVMPFKNLTRGSDLEWLSVGISETMVTDLRKNGVRVVERDRLDDALAELALVGKTTDAGSAARLGKMVGAKTVVVGGYQKSGKNVRITARFVTVETGVVKDTAKVTGKVSRIFKLQDQIVAKLLGKKPKVRRRTLNAKRRSKKQTKKVSAEKTLEAYRVYTLSLETSSKAKRIRYLKEALEIDPDFVYALDDLDRLELKLKRFDVDRAKLEDQKLAKLLTAVRTDSQPHMRSANANMVMVNLYTKYRCSELFSVAKEFQSHADWFTNDDGMVARMSDYWTLHCLFMMRRQDEAMQAGEVFLSRYPESNEANQVRSTLGALLEQRRESIEKQESWPKKLADLKKRETRDLDRHRKSIERYQANIEKYRDKRPERAASEKARLDEEIDRRKKTIVRHKMARFSGLSSHHLFSDAEDYGRGLLEQLDKERFRRERDRVFRTLIQNAWWTGQFTVGRELLERWESDGANEKDIEDQRKNMASWPT